MSYNDPSQGHTEAISMISTSRSAILKYLRNLQADRRGDARIHPNLIDGAHTPTKRTAATAALTDYLMQLRPYRDAAQLWDMGLGTITLPETYQPSLNIANEPDPGELTIRGENRFELGSLSDVIDMTGYEVVYERPKYRAVTEPKGPLMDDEPADVETEVFQFVLRTEEIRTLFERADDVAASLGFLAEMDTPDIAANGGDAV